MLIPGMDRRNVRILLMISALLSLLLLLKMNEVGVKLSNTSQIYVQPAAKDDLFDDTPLAKAFTATDIAHAGFMLSLFLEWTQFQ